MNNTSQTGLLHKRILFLVSLPNTQEFWEYAPEVMQCCHKLNDFGVIVRHEISKDSMADMCNFDVVVIMAHLDQATDELVLVDSRLGIPDFLSYIPDGFTGLLDFSSCYSSFWINSIKEKCPNCKVSGAEGQTVLPFRLFIYPYVIQLFLSDDAVSYEEAYRTVQDFVKKEMEEGEDNENGNANSIENINLGLGGKMSSVFAPTKVVKGKTFVVQLILHDESESLRRVTIQAKRYDSESRRIETLLLPIELNKGDRIAVRFEAISVPAEHISIDNAVKEIRWNGESGKIQFNVTVLDRFSSDSFIGKLLMEVNHEPVGESSFRIQIAEKENLAPSPVDIKSRDAQSEGEDSRSKLKLNLQEHLANLYDQLANDKNGANKSDLEKAIDTCKLCIHLVDNPINDELLSRPRKVFISSTCETFMKPYREAVRNVVSSLKMEPEMCDDWPQSGCNPTNVCCQKVLDSDIYLGVFGGRYGYIEPSLNSSMTQMEYLTAVSAKKKILLFVIKPINETDEPEPIKKRQDAFIKNLERSRILRTFGNSMELSELAKNDLLDFIARK